MNRVEKKELLVKCKIEGYERGVITKNDGYRSRDYPLDYKGYEKDRVIAVNCTEVKDISEKDKFQE